MTIEAVVVGGEVAKGADHRAAQNTAALAGGGGNDCGLGRQCIGDDDIAGYEIAAIGDHQAVCQHSAGDNRIPIAALGYCQVDEWIDGGLFTRGIVSVIGIER